MVLILADTITADMGLIPGLAFIGPAMGLPLSVLAAFLERPFYTLGGISRQTIWYSLQANLTSLLVGYAGMFIAFGIGDSLREYDAPFLIWPFCAVAVSIVVEGRYLSRRQRPNKAFWVWNSIGNVLSAAACIGLLFPISYLYARFPGWKIRLEPFNFILNASAFAGSVVLFLVAFWRTWKTTTTPRDE
jgi:hypothetical protein